MRTAFILALTAFGVSPALAEEKRAAHAHEHGHGSFQMAIEDDHAEIELEVPAFDVVGFEHAPSTQEQRQAIADAAAKLSRPGDLFALPNAAGCVAGEIEIAFGAVGGHSDDHDEEDHDDHAHDDHDDHADKDHEDHAEDEEGHSEVTVRYHLACADTGALDRITFTYFDAFPNAEELEVVVLSAAGQSAGEVGKDETVFEIE